MKSLSVSATALLLLLLDSACVLPAASFAQANGVAGDWVFTVYERGEVMTATRGSWPLSTGP